MANKFTKLNYRFGLLEFPVTLVEMEEISKEFPKTERKFYEYALKALKKDMKPDERIYCFNGADPKLTKTGFIVVAENNLHFIILKGGLTGGADAETVKYSDIKSVDFDIAPNPLGAAQMDLGILYLEVKKAFGTKKRTIRNIPEHSLDNIVQSVRSQVDAHQ